MKFQIFYVFRREKFLCRQKRKMEIFCTRLKFQLTTFAQRLTCVRYQEMAEYHFSSISLEICRNLMLSTSLGKFHSFPILFPFLCSSFFGISSYICWVVEFDLRVVKTRYHKDPQVLCNKIAPPKLQLLGIKSGEAILEIRENIL